MCQTPLDLILFLPAGDPWQKSHREITPGRHRLAMTELAVAGVDGFATDDREILRAGASYTIDTLESFSGDDEIFLVLGVDAALGIDTWHRASDVKQRARFLVLPRPGFDPGELRENLPAATVLEMEELDLSSTAIRRRAREGEPFRFLVPYGVYEYIVENGLYTQTPPDDKVRPQSYQEG